MPGSKVAADEAEPHKDLVEDAEDAKDKGYQITPGK